MAERILPAIIASETPSKELVEFCKSNPEDAAAFIDVATRLVPFALDVPQQEIPTIDWLNWIGAINNGAMMIDG